MCSEQFQDCRGKCVVFSKIFCSHLPELNTLGARTNCEASNVKPLLGSDTRQNLRLLSPPKGMFYVSQDKVNQYNVV